MPTLDEIIATQLANFESDDQDNQDDLDPDAEQDSGETGEQDQDPGSDDAEGDDGDQDNQDEAGDKDKEESGKDETFEVKVDGQVQKVTLKELQDGYLRQSDYTKKRQESKGEIDRLKAEHEQLSAAAEFSRSINDRFNQDPDALIGDMFMAVHEGKGSEKDNTNTWLEVTKYLLGTGYLGADVAAFLQVSDDGKRALSTEAKNRQARNSKALELAERERQLAPAAQADQERKEAAEYESKANDILSGVATSKGIPEAEQAAFSAEVFKRVLEDEIYDLKSLKSVALLVYREQQLAKRDAAPAKPAAKKRPATTNRPTGGGSGAPGSGTSGRKLSLEEIAARNLNKLTTE